MSPPYLFSVFVSEDAFFLSFCMISEPEERIFRNPVINQLISGRFLSAFTTSLWFALLIYGAVIKFKKDKPVSIAYIIILLFQLAILAFGIYPPVLRVMQIYMQFSFYQINFHQIIR